MHGPTLGCQRGILSVVSTTNMKVLAYLLPAAVSVTVFATTIYHVIYARHHVTNGGKPVDVAAVLRPVANTVYTPRKFTRECGVITNLKTVIGCDLCKTFVTGLKYLIELEVSEDKIVEFSTYICKEFKIEDDRVCESITVEFKVEYIMESQGGQNGILKNFIYSFINSTAFI